MINDTIQKITFNEIIEYSPQNQEYFKKLSGLCKNGYVVPYIGAGLSVFADLPLWEEFIKKLNDKCHNKNFSTENFFEAADEIEYQLGKEEFYRIFKETFHHNKNDDWWKNKIKEKNVEKQAISVIQDLFNGPIITTNFDKILEAVHDFRIPVVFPHDVKLLEDANKKRKRLIYKVHGCVSEVEKVIFTGESYKEAYSHNTELVKTLSDFLKGFNFLFLGSALDLTQSKKDKPIELWETLVNFGQQHYAILPCSKENEEKRRAELEDRNILPIFFPEGKFEAIKIILDELLMRKNKSALKIPQYKYLYVNRETILKKLEQHLLNETFSILVLTGMGGVGKTRIACEYGKMHENKYSSGVYFMRAISGENVQAEIFRFALEKNLISENEKDQELVLQRVKNWMNGNDNWLFILDNVEHYEHIEKFLKFDTDITLSVKQHFLITSRKQNLTLQNNIPVGIFDINEARDFFHTHVKGQEPDKYADDIAKTLGYLPLALEQATAYIEKRNINYEKYLKELEREGVLEKLKQGNQEDEALAVGTTYNISLRMIEMEESKQLLNLFAFFASDNIDCNWFRDANEQFNAYPALQEKIKIEDEYRAILKELEEYSLVRLENDKINIHRLTQEVVKKALKEKKRVFDTCVQILNELRFTGFFTKNSRTRFHSIIPHVESVIEEVNDDNATVEISQLYHFLADGLDELADYDRALEYYDKALFICKRTFNDKNLNIADIYNNKAGVHVYKGNYIEALKCYKKALNIYILGNDDLNVAKVYNNMAGIYFYKGKYINALKYYKKALNIRERFLGKEDPDTATTYNGIATVYDKKGNPGYALDFFEKALCVREKILGKEHLDTAITYNNMATHFYNNGKSTDALKYYEKALKIRESILGKDHPDTAEIYNNIALIHENNGNNDYSLEYYEKALRIYVKVFGRNHPNTATIYNNIAFVYDNKKNYIKALEYYKKSLNIRENVLGKEHPDTAGTYNNMAWLYCNKKDYDLALEYYQKALNVFEKVLGKKHPDTQTVLNNMQMAYEESCKYK